MRREAVVQTTDQMSRTKRKNFPGKNSEGKQKWHEKFPKNLFFGVNFKL